MTLNLQHEAVDVILTQWLMDVVHINDVILIGIPVIDRYTSAAFVIGMLYELEPAGSGFIC